MNPESSPASFSGLAPEERAALFADKAAHLRRLRIAAGISSIELRCHRDTWYTIKDVVYGLFFSFDAPRPSGGNGIVTVELSGPDLFRALHRTYRCARFRLPPFFGVQSRLIAERLYAACAERIAHVEAGNTDGSTPDPIVIDDRVPGQPE